jgi:hypothetical protein
VSTPSAVPPENHGAGTPVRLRHRWKWTAPGVALGGIATWLGFGQEDPLFLLVGFSLMSASLGIFLLVGLVRDAKR